MKLGTYTFGIGGLIALIVLVLVIIFAVLGQLPLLLAGLIGGLAVARLVP
jgi:hypothetical protein